jgi:hypothetical protein
MYGPPHGVHAPPIQRCVLDLEVQCLSARPHGGHAWWAPSHGQYEYGPPCGSGFTYQTSSEPCFPNPSDRLPPMRHVMFGVFSNPEQMAQH